MNYIESDLQLNFPADWQLKRYDNHRYFKQFSGMGLKGVDFLVITPSKKLILIEIKNYGDRGFEDVHPSLYDHLMSPGELALTIKQKIHDTKRGILAINTFYNSHWYYKKILRIYAFVYRLTGRILWWYFWLLAAQALKNSDNINLLIINVNESYPMFSKSMVIEFKKKLELMLKELNITVHNSHEIGRWATLY